MPYLWIGNNMNFFLRKLFRNVIPPEDEAEHLIKVVCGSAYGLFLDQHFREMVNFEKQNQTERDRMFNELVVTALLLLLSAVKDRIYSIELGRQEFWRRVHEIAPDYFFSWLGKIGVAKQYLDIWKKLLDLRLNEYQERQSQTRQVWADEIYKRPEEEQLSDAMVRVETLTVSSMLHISRGQAERDDPLRRRLRTWLSVLNNKSEKRIGW